MAFNTNYENQKKAKVKTLYSFADGYSKLVDM